MFLLNDSDMILIRTVCGFILSKFIFDNLFVFGQSKSVGCVFEKKERSSILY